MRKHLLLLATLGAATAAIVGCGGGGGGNTQLAPVTKSAASTPTAPPSAGASAAVMSSATFTLTLPASTTTSSNQRMPAYISAATQSIAITVAAGSATPAPPIVANLTTSSSNCTTTTAGLTCSVYVPAPVGADTFGVTLYQGQNATGNVLSTATVSGNVAATVANTIPITLGGIVATAAIVVQNGNLVVPGTAPTSLPVTITAKDASGATIVGPYANALTLTDSDTTHVTALSTTTVPSSSTAVSLAFTPANGALPNGGPVSIGGSGSGVGTVTPGTFQYVPVVQSVTFSVTPTSVQGPSPATATLSMVAKDSTGTAITVAAPYITPIAVSNSDSTGGITLSAASFTKPTDTVTVNYSGAAATTSTTFSTTTVSTVTPVTLAIPPPHQSIYIVDISPTTPGVYVFAPGANGNVAPIRAITGSNTGLYEPHGVALDKAGNIYIASYNNQILVFAPDANGNALPIRTITGSMTGFTGSIEPWGMSFDASGNLWVTMWQLLTYNNGAMEEFAPGATGNAAPIAVIQGSNTNAVDANSVVVDSSGNIDEAGTTPNSIAQYAPGSNGNVTPIREVAGSAAFPGDDDVLFQQADDQNGNVYVAESTTPNIGAVLGWPLSDTGNVAPTFTLTGSNTGFSTGIRGLLFDAAGYMYVSVQNSAHTATSILVFAPGASGNTAPTRTIAGSNTVMLEGGFMAISP